MFLADLCSRPKIKDLGETTYYLGEATTYSGCNISRNKQERELKIDKHLYAQTIAERCGIVKTSMIPATVRVNPLSKEGGPQTPEETEELQEFLYRKAVGRSCGRR